MNYFDYPYTRARTCRQNTQSPNTKVEIKMNFLISISCINCILQNEKR